jgi:hypothetical protein
MAQKSSAYTVIGSYNLICTHKGGFIIDFIITHALCLGFYSFMNKGMEGSKKLQELIIMYTKKPHAQLIESTSIERPLDATRRITIS